MVQKASTELRNKHFKRICFIDVGSVILCMWIEQSIAKQAEILVLLEESK